MSGKAARTKGHNWERKVAGFIRAIFGDPKDEALKAQIKRGYQNRNNIDLIEDVVSPMFSIECKCYKANPPIKKAFRQAEATAEKHGGLPVAIIKEDNIDPYVVLSYDDFIGLFAVLATLYGKEKLLGSDKELIKLVKDECHRIKGLFRDPKEAIRPGKNDPKPSGDQIAASKQNTK